jgi:predicted DNA-binding transcriptional regulator YafY
MSALRGDLTRRVAAAIALLSTGWVSTAQLAGALHVTGRTAYRVLDGLREAQLPVERGHRAGAVVFRLPERWWVR